MSPAMATAAIVLGIVTLISSILFLYFRRFPVHLIYKSKIGFASMLDAIGDPLVVVDSNYVVSRVNKAYTNLVGRSFSQSIGQKCYSLLRHRDKPCTDCLLTQAIESDSHQTIERTSHPSGGGAISIGFSRYGPAIENQPSRWIIEHIRDITPLEKLKNDLEEKNRSIAKTMRHLKAAQQRIRDELRLARQIQQGILPTTSPSFAGLQIETIYHPVADVGGDIYDFIPFSSNRFGVFIGDASGHGLSSAFVGTISKMSLYNHSKEEMIPNSLLAKINTDLLTNIHTSHYLTCFWGVIDIPSKTFTFSRAGHPIPIIVRASGEIVPLQCSGTFLGIIEDAEFETRTVTIEPGARIFLFTDGIYDAYSLSGKREMVLGYDRFVELLADCKSVPFNKVMQRIKRQLATLTYEDDYTLIAIEFGQPESDIASEFTSVSQMAQGKTTNDV